jgi:hypothetical protein
MDSRKILEIAHNLVIQHYGKLIREIILDKERPVLKIVFNFKVGLNIRYNDFGEYSYSVIFTPNPDDHLRFDNYDYRWDVNTRPHHFHIRGLKSTIESPMVGDQNHDIPILLKIIQDYSKKK